VSNPGLEHEPRLRVDLGEVEFQIGFEVEGHEARSQPQCYRNGQTRPDSFWGTPH
jgi:hypothetical protein